jgi:hypothetical protein
MVNRKVAGWGLYTRVALNERWLQEGGLVGVNMRWDRRVMVGEEKV